MGLECSWKPGDVAGSKNPNADGEQRPVECGDVLEWCWRVWIQDAYVVCVDGGSSTGGSWQTRPLNTEVYDVNSIVTLSSNQFVLGTGTYEVSASGVFGGAAGTQIAFKHRIRNITDSTTAAVGASCRLHIPSGSSAGTEALVPLTRITLAAQKTFELQYFAQNGLATNGLGFPTSSAEVERYASVLIRKVA
jgi:hypothetical protein